jgi:hypothetical protein
MKMHTVGKHNKFDLLCVDKTLSSIRFDVRLNNIPISMRTVAHTPHSNSGEIVRMRKSVPMTHVLCNSKGR